ncbi:hypothetical protein Q5H92_10270 [Hymenobacter sp. M29]|uniref:Glycosyl transferase family 1 domain-containing protein n=1 Tax=Hymenobacter mellowenesis TaxID=3063995 RepID=A0ABT9ADG8_9BACT|nr:hypothetical protein [Hymenobacter sp. M29]MDO7846742.1 hypothetical protein [Hymenobacter sp. M29]
MPTIQGARYRLSKGLISIADRLYRVPGGEIANIGADNIKGKKKYAFIKYSIYSIPYYIAGDVMQCPVLNEHSMYWESAEMVRQLNERGYVVDYHHVHSKAPIDWSKYDLVIDEGNNLITMPDSARRNTVKVFYATSNYWLFQNMAEIHRIRDFQARNKLYISPARQTIPNYSNEIADYMTYMGTDFQLRLFQQPLQKHRLNISAVYEPEYHAKDIASARKKFVWLGSNGLLLKGLDLVVEAFARMPELTLYIGGHLEQEERLWSWLKPMFAKHSNLVYLGWVDVGSQKFFDLAKQCIGTVYLSSSEGGGGAVVQLAHFGLIPIVTEASTVREELATVIKSDEPEEIIAQTVQAVQELVALSDEELDARSRSVYQYASTHHTRKAYAESFSELLDLIELKS